MRLLLSLSFLALLSSACETTSGGGASASGGRREIVGLEEMSLEYIESQWGKPEANVPTGDGRTVTFRNVTAEDEDPISGKITPRSCDVKLVVGKNLLVKTWVYESCKPK